MKCKCGFKFAGPGEFKNHQSILTLKGWADICPECGATYLHSGEKINLADRGILLTDEQRRKQLDNYFKNHSE